MTHWPIGYCELFFPIREAPQEIEQIYPELFSMIFISLQFPIFSKSILRMGNLILFHYFQYFPMFYKNQGNLMFFHFPRGF